MSQIPSLLLNSESFRKMGPFLLVIPVLIKCLGQMGCNKIFVNQLINKVSLISIGVVVNISFVD